MINLTAPINSLGYGVVGVGLAKALRSLGAAPALFPIGPVDCSSDDRSVLQELVSASLRYRPEAPSLRLWHAWEMAQHPTRGIRSGATFFELDRLRPDEVHQMNQLDLIFSFGAWSAGVMRNSGVTTRMCEIHCGVDTSIFLPTPLPKDGPTVFVNAGKWEIRKGHDILLSAFTKAFRSDDDVRLIMLCDNPFLSPSESSEWIRYYKDHPLGDKVVVVPRQPTHRDVASVFAQAHCGVFPSRGEGWNMEAMELMAMGRHVIATDASAHTDYMGSENAMLVPVGLPEYAFDGKWFSGQGMWASIPDSSVAEFASNMRHVHERQKKGLLMPNIAGTDTCRTLSWESAALKIIKELGVVCAV